MNNIEFLQVNSLDLEQSFTQLGMSDYVYIRTHQYLERIEQYRTALLKHIEELQNGDGENLDNRSGVQFDNRKEIARGILADQATW